MNIFMMSHQCLLLPSPDLHCGKKWVERKRALFRKYTPSRVRASGGVWPDFLYNSATADFCRQLYTHCSYALKSTTVPDTRQKLGVK